MVERGRNLQSEKVKAEITAASKQPFLAFATDAVFALFVFFLVFRLPSIGLAHWATIVEMPTTRVALNFARLLVIVFGILWCVAFAFKSTAAFLKYLVKRLITEASDGPFSF